MCGICGYINFKAGRASVSAGEIVRRMNAALRHRGPDDEGYYDAAGFSLGHSRLSIIDLASGHQPIFNEDRSLGIVFNGEIYNYKGLREKLVTLGHEFTTDSDTEVILHLYEEYGEAAPAYLKGMFAFCIFSVRGDRFFFSRDRFGEKPLYYSNVDGVFSFSSEPASLMESPAVPRQLDLEALAYYLRIAFVPEPQTLLKDVFSLRPGHWMLVDAEGVREQKYFKIDYAPDSSIRTLGDAADYIKPFLADAVSRQTVSDVPIGAFLSGGIDSSTVVAFLQEQSSRPVKTFTVKFGEASYDESRIAKDVANHLGTDHTEITIPNAKFTNDVFWEIVNHVGLPFPDSSAIPTWFVTREIRKHAKVALSGDGGDELFAGYPVFDWWQRVHRLGRLPGPLLASAEWMVRRWASVQQGNTQLRKIARALEAARYKGVNTGLALHSLFTEKDLRALNSDSAVTDWSWVSMPADSECGWSVLRQAMYYRLVYDLPLDMLTKVDRMSMANSLEVRAPFLDPDLFEASCRLPDWALMSGGAGKLVLREAVKGKLPRSVFDHPKQGFSIPFHSYMNADFSELVGGLLGTGGPLGGLLNHGAVDRIVRRGLASKADNATASVYRATHQLWSLLLLAGWVDRFRVAL